MSAAALVANTRGSLRRYLLAWTLGVLVFVWLALLAHAANTGFHEARKFSDGQMVTIARLWLRAAPGATGAAVGSGGQRPQVLPALSHEFLQDVAVMAWEDGRLVTDTHGLHERLELKALGSAGFTTLQLAGGEEGVDWRAFVAQHSDAGAVHKVAVLTDMRQHNELGRDIAEHVAELALLVLPLFAGLLWWAIRRGLRPLDSLSLEVGSLDGLAGQRLEDRHRYREFASTVVAINKLVDTLQAAARRERAFASDVAHELRTPLAAITLQANAARHDPSPERMVQLGKASLRAGHILQQLLELARAQRGADGKTPDWRDVDLGELASQLVASHAPGAHECGHELALRQPPDPVVARVQPMLLELALRNLIDNALRHTPPGTLVVVDVWQNAQVVGMSISDDGRRVLAAAPDVADSSGLGLGLRLVERIVEQLDARLVVDSAEPPMTTRYTLQWSRT